MPTVAGSELEPELRAGSQIQVSYMKTGTQLVEPVSMLPGFVLVGT